MTHDNTREALLAENERLRRERDALRRAVRRQAGVGLRLRRLFESANDVLFHLSLDPEPAFLYVSPSVQELLGYAPTEFYADYDLAFRVVEPEDLERLLQRLHRGDPPTERDQIRMRHKDGRILWIDRHQASILDASGRLVAIEGVMRDISALKKTSTDLRRSEEFARSLFRGLPAPTFIWRRSDDDFILEDYNDAARQLGPEDLRVMLRMTAETFYRERNPGVIRDMELCWRERREVRGQEYYRHISDGAVRFYDVRYAFMPPDRVILHGLDLTESKRLEGDLRQSEERFKAIVKSIPTPLYIFQRRGGRFVFTDFNDAALALSQGAAPCHLGETAEDYFREKEPQIVKDMETCFASRGTVRRRFYHHMRLVAAARFLDVGYSFVPPDLVMVHVMDLTDLKGMEEELVRAKEAAEAASRAKTLFLASMSHEMRTPLTAVLGYADMLLASETDPERRRVCRSIVGAGGSLLSLIADILDFSRIEAGAVALEERVFVLRDALRDTQRLLAPEARKKGLELSFHAHPLLPERLMGDATRLRQILTNLTGNAIKFTAQGRVEVEAAPAEASTASKDGWIVLRVTVRDTGCGVPPDMREVIFAPFTQADAAFSRRFQGAGLGLAICRCLAEKMGGRIALDNQIGPGSTFSLTAPFRIAPPQDGADVPALPPAATARPLHVLLVEDNEDNRIIARHFLERGGHAVSEAATGLEALEIVPEAPFDVALMDVEMPGMDGLETVRRIRRGEAKGVPPDTPVLALTAHAVSGDRERCLAAGMDGYLPKPVRKKDLLRAVAEIADAAAGRRASPERTTSAATLAASPGWPAPSGI